MTDSTQNDAFGEWSLRGFKQPWSERLSIYRFICDCLQTGDTWHLNNDCTLPDEVLVRGENEIGFAPGALEGMLAYGTFESFVDWDADENLRGDSTPIAPFNEQEYTLKLLSALREFIAVPTDESALAFYHLIVHNSANTAINLILNEICSDTILPISRVVEVGRWLTTEAADREAVKFGLALICLSHSTAYRDILLTLGRHEEFTPYVAAALQNTEPEPDRLLWELAQQLYGWGRVTLVEHLANAKDPDIMRWMLTEGFENYVHNDEINLVCARTGDLYAAVQQAEIDLALFNGIGRILCNLIAPNYNSHMIAEYSGAVDATALFLKLMLAREMDLDNIEFVTTVNSFLQHRADTLDLPPGWRNRKAELLDLITAIQSRPEWTKTIQDGLTSEDAQTRIRAGNINDSLNAEV